MKIKECIKLAADVLNLDASLENGRTDELLLRCANNCIDEIVSEYLPIVDEKEVEAKEGKIPYSLLGETVFDVVAVEKEGVKVPFKQMPAHLKVEDDGKYVVTFYSRPHSLGAEDDVPITLHIGPRVISYGIAAEYMLINGFYEEAMMYDKRFKDALVRLMHGDREKRVKRRRWIL